MGVQCNTEPSVGYFQGDKPFKGARYSNGV